jgi:hypothetical protein
MYLFCYHAPESASQVIVNKSSNSVCGAKILSWYLRFTFDNGVIFLMFMLVDSRNAGEERAFPSEEVFC